MWLKGRSYYLLPDIYHLKSLGRVRYHLLACHMGLSVIEKVPPPFLFWPQVRARSQILILTTRILRYLGFGRVCHFRIKHRALRSIETVDQDPFNVVPKWDDGPHASGILQRSGLICFLSLVTKSQPNNDWFSGLSVLHWMMTHLICFFMVQYQACFVLSVLPMESLGWQKLLLKHLQRFSEDKRWRYFKSCQDRQNLQRKAWSFPTFG